MTEKRKPREFVVINRNEKLSPLSFWDKFEKASKIISLIGIPVIIAIFGTIIQKQLSDKNLNKEYVEIAVSVLANPNTSENNKLRKWAVELLDSKSPTKFSEETAEDLRTGGLSLPPSTASNYRVLAQNYQSTGQYAEALQYYSKAMELNKEILGSEHPDTAKTFSNLSGVYLSMGNYIEALKYSQKALSIQGKSLSAEHPDVALTYYNVGAIYGAMGEYKKSLKYLSKAYFIQKKSIGNSDVLRNTVASIMNTYNLLGMKDKSITYRKKLEELLKSANISTEENR